MAKNTASNVARLAAAAMESVASDAESATEGAAEPTTEGEVEQRGRVPYVRMDRMNRDGEWGRLPVRLEVMQANEEFVFKRFGVGKYQVHHFGPGKDGKMVVIKRWIMVVEDPTPGGAPSPSVPGMTVPSGDLNVQLHQQMLEQGRQSSAQMASIIAQSQESHAAMLTLFLKPPPPPPTPPDTMAGIAAMIAAFAPIIANLMPARVAPADPAETAARLLAVLRESQPEKPKTADFIEMLKVAQSMAAGRAIGEDDEGEGDSELMQIVKATAPAVTAIVQAASQRGTPAPVAPVREVTAAPVPVALPAPRPLVRVPLTMAGPAPDRAGLDLLDTLVEALAPIAAEGRPGSHQDAVDWLFRSCTPAQQAAMRAAVADPGAQQQLALRYPTVKAAPGWWRAMLAALRTAPDA